MPDISHRIATRAPISKVYAALATVEGIAGWWSRSTSGASVPGGSVDVRFHSPDGAEMGAMAFDVVELAPERAVRWRLKAGPAEWLGTEVSFDLAQDGEFVIVLFGHRHWREAGEFMAHCSMKWATFMLSLKQLVETGWGAPAPDDVKIDNWN